MTPDEIRAIVVKLCEKVEPRCPYVFFHYPADGCSEGESSYGIYFAFVQTKGWIQATPVGFVMLTSTGKLSTQSVPEHPAAREAEEICKRFQYAFDDFMRDKENAGLFDTRIP